MNKLNKEICLSYAFSIEILSNNLVNVEKSLDIVCDALFIDNKDKQVLDKLINLNEVKEITSLNDYNRSCRISKFLKANGQEQDKDLEEVINLKGQALFNARNLNFKVDSSTSSITSFNQIYDNAYKGVIDAKIVLGILQCEGIYCNQNLKGGIKNLKEASSWNNILATLLLLKYDSSNIQNHINTLYTLTKNTPYEFLYNKAEIKYNLSYTHEVEEVKLLLKSFTSRNINKDTYNIQIAKIIHSPCLLTKDKEKILFSSSDDFLADNIELPLSLRKKEYDYDLNIVSIENFKKVLQKIVKKDYNMPLCININSNYSLNIYKKFINKAFSHSNVKYIDVSSLLDEELANTGSNYFVRSCDEKKHNLYVLELKGEIHPLILKKVITLLKNKLYFMLTKPNIELNLSAIDLLVFATKNNINKLKDVCEVISLDEHLNKAYFLDSILKEKQEDFKLSSLELEPLAKEELLKLDIDKAYELINLYVKENVKDNKVNIDLNKLRKIERNAISNFTYGFKEVHNEKI